MSMNDFNYTEIPLTIAEDLNKAHTTWFDNKCVRMDEERWMTYFAFHKVEERTIDMNNERKVQKVCLAVPVRVKKGCGTVGLLKACGDNDELFKEVYPLFEKDNKEIVRAELCQAIRDYDKSEAVNSFYLNGEAVWLDKDTRVGLMNSTQIQKAAGVVVTELWFKGKSYSIECDKAIQMLSALELYALKCYNVTAQHLSEVDCLNEGFNQYDYTVGYPEKPSF